MKKIVLGVAAIALAAGLSVPAMAQTVVVHPNGHHGVVVVHPHPHHRTVTVCHVEHHHHHNVRVCRKVRR